MIIVVKNGDTLYSLSKEYSLPVSKIIADNGIVGQSLVVGQALVLAEPAKSEVTSVQTTVKELSQKYGISERTLFQNNYFLSGRQPVLQNSFVVLSYKNSPQTQKIIGGYAYDFIPADRLFSVINYLTYIIPFTYGFNDKAELVEPEDAFIVTTAKNAGTRVLMHISTLTDEGVFDNNLPSLIFDDESFREALVENIIDKVQREDFDGVDVDFEYLTSSQKSGYAYFVAYLAARLHQIGKILVVAVPPKTSDEQPGLLVEGIDYASLGENADYIMIMAYEYGYKFGPAMAIAPINQVRRALDYAAARVPEKKILLGISNYGYNWTLPFVEGKSDAPSISTVDAVELAKQYGAEIMFDEKSMAPYFFYTDADGRVHEVWFEDARSIGAKMGLIEEYRLAGGFIWDLMRENPQGFVTINQSVKIT